MTAPAVFDALPSIETPNLVLRQVTDADLPALFDVFSHAEVVRYWSAPALPDLGAAAELARSIDDGRRSGRLLQWALTRRGDDRLIGTCTLASIDRAHRRTEIGYALARQCWGLGLMAEALPALLRFAFETLGLHRIEADVDPRNAASIRTLRRLGFRLEGHLRERYFVGDEVQDSHIYALLRTDAPQVWAAPGR
jgi:ribosomal-protein-alanine N-acetyltransferase